jgi:hypothetical protein
MQHRISSNWILKELLSSKSPLFMQLPDYILEDIKFFSHCEMYNQVKVNFLST